MYTQNVTFFETAVNIPKGVMARYAFGDDTPNLRRKYNDDRTYEVLYCDAYSGKTLITEFPNDLYGKVYLIGLAGLERLPKQMAKEEIEKELGYTFEIV